MKAILEMTPEEVIKLQPKDVIGILTTEETAHIFAALEAFYMNNKVWSKPHVKLTSGLHSNGYINCPLVLKHPNLRMIFAQQMARCFQQAHPNIKISKTDWVVGSDTSATDLAGGLARVLGCRHGALKKEPNKEQVWQGEKIGEEIVKYSIQPGEKVLHIEELMTTAFTAERVRNGIKKAHDYVEEVEFIPVIIVLMHRSTIYHMENALILAVNHFDIQNWDPKEHCPYCANGSPVVENPKVNWNQLIT